MKEQMETLGRAVGKSAKAMKEFNNTVRGLRKYERMALALGRKVVDDGKEKTAPGFRKLVMQATIKAQRVGVDFHELVQCAASMGHGRRTLPFGLSKRGNLVRAAMKRLTRYERIAVNALAGTRPSGKNEFEQLAPMHPLKGEWLNLLPRGSKSKAADDPKAPSNLSKLADYIETATGTELK